MIWERPSTIISSLFSIALRSNQISLILNVLWGKWTRAKCLEFWEEIVSLNDFFPEKIYFLSLCPLSLPSFHPLPEQAQERHQVMIMNTDRLKARKHTLCPRHLEIFFQQSAFVAPNNKGISHCHSSPLNKNITGITSIMKCHILLVHTITTE